MAYIKKHARQNARVLTAALKIVAGDSYQQAWARYKSGELTDQLAEQFPDIPRRRLKHQAAKAYRSKHK